VFRFQAATRSHRARDAVERAENTHEMQKTYKHTQCNVVADQHMSPHSQCPGLRALQGRKELEKLVKRVKNTRDQMQWGPRGPPPLLIKIAPDLTDADKSDVTTVCLRLGVDGLVISNTTISRPGAVADHPTGSEVRWLHFCAGHISLCATQASF